MKKIILALIIAVAMQACSQKLDATTVANTKWVLNEWPGHTLPQGAQATLNFDTEGKIGGKSFCNSYGGNSVISSKNVKFDQIFSTKMFCNELSDAENKYQNELTLVNAMKLAQGKLTLLKDGVPVMVFVSGQ